MTPQRTNEWTAAMSDAFSLLETIYTPEIVAKLTSTPYNQIVLELVVCYANIDVYVNPLERCHKQFYMIASKYLTTSLSQPFIDLMNFTFSRAIHLLIMKISLC
eukprot:UN08174